MNQLGLIRISHDMTENLGDLGCWKGLDLVQLLDLIQGIEMKVDGVLLLSTCNRVEILYTIADPSRHLEFHNHLLNRLPDTKSLTPSHLTGRPVVSHLLRLASGLESMVLGETEIRHQLKEAVRKAVEIGSLDRQLHQLVQGVFRESREIRGHIPANLPLSMSSLSVRYMEEALGGFAATEGAIVVIGSGPMSRAGAEYVRKWGGRELILVNRTVAKIQDQADLIGGRAVSLQEFTVNPASFGPIRAILTATSSIEPIITAEMLQAIEKVSGQQLVVVDLALPADTAEDARPLCHFIGLETIRQRLDENRSRREEAANRAASFVEEAKYRLEAEWIAQVSAPVLREFQKDVMDRSRERLELLLKGHLAHLTSRDRRILHDWATRFNRDMNRIHRAGVERVLKFYYDKNGQN